MSALESLYRALNNPTDMGGVRSVIAGTKLLAKEYAGFGKFSVPLADRLAMWRRGFRSQASVLYDLETHNIDSYLSDFHREHTAWINGEWAVALDNKLVFHWMLSDFEQYRTATYGLIDNGRFHPVSSRRVAREQPMPAGSEIAEPATEESPALSGAADWICDRLTAEQPLVIKPVSSGGGKNVRVLREDNGAYYVSGEHHSESAFRSYLSQLEQTLVTEYVSQAQYATELFADATNTIRVLTMWDENRETPFIPIAVHRIGTARSEPVDNWSRGGLSAQLAVDSGTLGPGIQYPYSGELVEHETHPDTGTQIQGLTVPNWETIQSELLDIAQAYSHIPYIGWDIIVTDDGFRILEANNCTDVDLLQVHRPLLLDSRTRRFYERYDIL